MNNKSFTINRKNFDNFIIENNVTILYIEYLSDNFHLSLSDNNFEEIEINNLVSNQTITLSNLKSLKNIMIYESSIDLNLGNNLFDFDTLILNNSKDTDIIDYYGYLNRLFTYSFSLRDESIIIDEKYKDVNIFHLKNCNAEFTLNKYNKIHSLMVFNTDLKIKADFRILSILRIINNKITLVDLSGSTFQSLTNLSITALDFSMFKIDYYFKFLMNLSLNISLYKINLNFHKNCLKIEHFELHNNTKISSNFRFVLKDDDLNKYDNQIDLILNI